MVFFSSLVKGKPKRVRSIGVVAIVMKKMRIYFFYEFLKKMAKPDSFHSSFLHLLRPFHGFHCLYENEKNYG